MRGCARPSRTTTTRCLRAAAVEAGATVKMFKIVLRVYAKETDQDTAQARRQPSRRYLMRSEGGCVDLG